MTSAREILNEAFAKNKYIVKRDTSSKRLKDFFTKEANKPFVF